MSGQRELEKDAARRCHEIERQLKEQQAQEVAEKEAGKKKEKRMDFLLDLLKALLVAAFTLIVEHFGELLKWIQEWLH